MYSQSKVDPFLNRLFTLSVSAAALVTTPAAMAQEDAENVGTTVEAAVEAAGEAMPVRLVSWEGDFELLKTSRRMRIWRSHIAYNLTVDAEGNATDCVLTEPFRLRRVSDRLCDVLLEHQTFAPALDASGTAV